MASSSSESDDQPLATKLKPKPSVKKEKKPNVKKEAKPRAELSKDRKPKIERTSDDDAVIGNKKRTVSPKKAVKVKKESKPKAKKEMQESTVKRPSKKPKKEFGKPGQKHDEPPFLDCLRLFYESLYNEERAMGRYDGRGPLSMAEQWCMERGVFDLEHQTALFNRSQKGGQLKKR
ncbi:hypothetical protein PBRA_000116 [Plasmodiophora brassicae]|uniref:Uncharacterized protein n=1 Tax=Plasmodiophora brassicae TaxID=37360 RepID=A0A0G4IGU6_PLABS|nr:hypothetical protein PBRA_000116 [Plasmodiophora brassicae]